MAVRKWVCLEVQRKETKCLGFLSSTGLFEVRAQEYLETLPIGEHSGVNKFLKGLGKAQGRRPHLHPLAHGVLARSLHWSWVLNNAEFCSLWHLTPKYKQGNEPLPAWPAGPTCYLYSLLSPILLNRLGN